MLLTSIRLADNIDCILAILAIRVLWIYIHGGVEEGYGIRDDCDPQRLAKLLNSGEGECAARCYKIGG